MKTILELDGISAGYGSAMIIHDVCMQLKERESVALLGKNGMGKSTLLKAIMGYLPKKSGSIRMLDCDTTKLKPHKIARLGIAYAAQEQAIFTELSVRTNLLLGLKRPKTFRHRFNEILHLFPVFKDRLNQHAGTLSGGEQKMLLVARSLMQTPEVIILDEITEGLQPSVINCLADALVWERRVHGTSMLIVEQNIDFAMKATQRYMVLKQGHIIDEGNCSDDGARQKIMNHLKV